MEKNNHEPGHAVPEHHLEELSAAEWRVSYVAGRAFVHRVLADGSSPEAYELLMMRMQAPLPGGQVEVREQMDLVPMLQCTGAVPIRIDDPASVPYVSLADLEPHDQQRLLGYVRAVRLRLVEIRAQQAGLVRAVSMPAGLRRV